MFVRTRVNVLRIFVSKRPRALVIGRTHASIGSDGRPGAAARDLVLPKVRTISHHKPSTIMRYNRAGDANALTANLR